MAEEKKPVAAKAPAAKAAAPKAEAEAKAPAAKAPAAKAAAKVYSQDLEDMFYGSEIKSTSYIQSAYDKSVKDLATFLSVSK